MRETLSVNEWQVIHLAQEGLSPIEIKQKIKRSTTRSISVVLSRARKLGYLERQSIAGGMHMWMPRSIHEAINDEAARRGMGGSDLARLVLRNVIDDNLFKAVLEK